MAIQKGPAAILTEAGDPLGEGTGYLHLMGAPGSALRPVSGTVTTLHWGAAQPLAGELYQIRWADGRRLRVRCTKYSPTSCGPAIFKFAVEPDVAPADFPALSS